MSERNRTLDIAKGIGIILVVFGHNWAVSHEPGELFRLIFSFHMPLFFFLSGTFLRTTDNFKKFAYSKADGLLKPYFAAVLISAFFHITLVFIKTKEISFDGLQFVYGAVYGTGSTLEWVPLWFLPHLFTASCATYVVLRFTTTPKWILMVASVFLAVGTFMLSNNDLPWSLDLLPISMSFILAGFALNKQTKAIQFKTQYFWGALIIFITLHFFFDETINLNHRYFGYLPVATLQALLGIYLCLSASSFLAKINIYANAGRMLSYIGSGSLFILIFHYFFQEKIFNVLNKEFESQFLAITVSFFSGVLVPILIWEASKRNKLAAKVFLPR